MPRSNGKLDVTCEMCGKTFQVHPYRIRQGVRFCSKKCNGLWSRGKPSGWRILPPDEQIGREYESGDTLKDIAQRYGVTQTAVSIALKRAGIKTRPPTGANLRTPECLAKVKKSYNRGPAHHNYIHIPVEEAKELYESGVSSTELALRYGVASMTVVEKIRAAGAKIRRPGFGKWYKCSDGHLVQSSWEHAVDEWLFEHGIPHEVHPYLPWNKKRRGDFRVGDVFIEVWGTEGVTSYDKRRLEKTANYRKHGFKLLEIFPHHVLDKDYSMLESLMF